MPLMDITHCQPPQAENVMGKMCSKRVMLWERKPEIRCLLKKEVNLAVTLNQTCETV